MRSRIDIGSGPNVNFSAPARAPAYYGPDSMHWRVFKNPVALGIGGICAVLLEFAEPRVRSGVWDHSTYKIDPIGRSQRTGVAAMASVYAPRETAQQMIAGITRMHQRVTGQTPAGQPYRAMDPELLNWVYATAGYGFLKAYDRFVRPLSAAEQARYWQEGDGIAALWGVTHTPQSEDDFLQMMDALAPGFEPHPINREFLEIVRTTTAAQGVPPFVRRAITRAAVALLPPRVRADRWGPKPSMIASWFSIRLVSICTSCSARRICGTRSPSQYSVASTSSRSSSRRCHRSARVRLCSAIACR